MKRILVTGSAGFIGRNFVETMRRGGAHVIGSDCVGLDSDDFHRMDLADREHVIRFIRAIAPTHIVHLGARTDLQGRSLEDYGANTAGVRNIIDGANAAGSVRRVLFASSRMVCRIDHIPAGYDDYSPPNAYGESKVEGERIVRSTEASFEWVIVRPTSIWGPGFGIPYRNFFDQIWRRRYFHQKGYNPRKSFGYVGNTIWQLERLIDAEGIHGRTFYLGDYEPLAVVDWANLIHTRFGLPGHIPTLPVGLLRLVAVGGDLANKVMARDWAPLTTFRLENLLADMVYPQLGELAAITGALPYTWQVGTDKTVEWLSRSS